MDTKTNTDLSSTQRIQILARRSGMERSLLVGEAIGSGLAAAWYFVESLGRRTTRAPRAVAQR